ncbi:hypothetical protein PT2222_310071 [Paraburkholderia tropica]
MAAASGGASGASTSLTARGRALDKRAAIACIAQGRAANVLTVRKRRGAWRSGVASTSRCGRDEVGTRAKAEGRFGPENPPNSRGKAPFWRPERQFHLSGEIVC